MKEYLQDLQRLLDFCIYQIYEKKNTDFDAEFYLDYISKKLKDLSDNQ